MKSHYSYYNVQNFNLLCYQCKNPLPRAVKIFYIDEIHLLAYVTNPNMPFIK